MEITGRARVGKKTKNLVQRLKPREIAVIDHQDLDEVSARGLIEAQPKCVINASSSISGKYPNKGPELLLGEGIPLIDEVGEAVLGIPDGTEIKVIDGAIYTETGKIAVGHELTLQELEKKMMEAKKNLSREIEHFIDNTLEYAAREKFFVIGETSVPNIKTRIEKKHVVVVVRGQDHRQDLAAIASYIDELEPVLIGVDGGADALLEMGYKPDLIVGDMDSVSDRALLAGAELIVHAYPDGRAPGLDRVNELGLKAELFPAPGTSEDIALLLAYEKGAELIVAVGTHSNVVDFLEKGRPGMASTFLVRLKVGPILIDAKGLSRIYKGRPRGSYALQVALAALIPLLLVLTLSTTFRAWWRLLLLQLRVIFLGY